MNFLEKLQQRWGLTSTTQTVLVIFGFAITGSTTSFMMKPIYAFIGIEGLWQKILGFIFLGMPVYQILLLVVGFCLGQFKFFLAFEKKMWGRFLPKKKTKEEV